MNLIKDRDARTRKRQEAKNKLDKQISLALINEREAKVCFEAMNSEGAVRLLDEGAIVTASGNLDLYIKKGTIRKFVEGKNEFLDNLTNRYEGTINIGHHDFATFPFIVGTWRKSDLAITDNGDGREGLDVDLKLNEAHPLVQALRVQGIPVGVSVEMYLHFNDADTEMETERLNSYTPVVDEIFIADFAIVGECGNVGSSGSVDFQGVKMEDSVKDTESMEDAVLEETAEENEMPESVEDTAEDAPTDAPTTEEAPTDAPTDAPTIEDEEDEEPEADESVEESTDDEAEDGEEADAEEDALAVAEERINTLEAENMALKEQVEALKKSNKKKENKIKENAERNAEFAKKFKGLDVSLGVTKEVKKEVTTKLYATGDGIGE